MKSMIGIVHYKGYNIVSGRHLRPATLNDVENATSWDVDSLRALMGSGCLYVSRNARSNVISEDESDTDESRDRIGIYILQLGVTPGGPPGFVVGL